MYKGRTYNGYAASEVVGEHGCLKLDLNVLKKGILTRGVLIDIPSSKGLPYLEPGTPIYTEDLEAWERKVGVRVTSGDAVFVRTGRWARLGGEGTVGPSEADRSGPRNLDSGLSEISIVFQAAVPKPVAPKYTTSGVRRPSEL